MTIWMMMITYDDMDDDDNLPPLEEIEGAVNRLQG